MIRRCVVLLAVSVLWSQTASAQVDLSGNWRALARNQDGSGMTGDAAGVPINEALRGRAESWSPEEFDVAEWVCRPHAWDYSLEGPLSQRFRRNRPVPGHQRRGCFLEQIERFVLR